MTYATKQLGRWGEEWAARFLKKKRYRIVERNYRCRLGEIDIVARWRETLIFVEVKTRRDEEDIPPQYSVNRRKQLQIIRTAHVYLKQHYLSGERCRFDVVAIVAGEGKAPREIRHFPGAFRL